MATVMLTSSIWSSIEHRLKELFNGRRVELNKKHEPLAQEMYDTLVPLEIQVLLVDVPKEYLFRGNEFNVHTGDDGFQFRFRLPALMPMNVNMGVYSSVPVPENSAVHPKLVVIQAEIDELNMEQAALVEEMKALYNKCATLNQLAKIWPTVLDFVDAGTLEKYRGAKIDMDPVTEMRKEEREAAVVQRRFDRNTELQKKRQAREAEKAAKQALRAAGPVVLDESTKVKLIKARMLSSS